MRKFIAIFLLAALAASCNNAASAADNSDFEGVWAANGVSLRFYSATVVWNEGAQDNKIYTFSASGGKITLTDRNGSTKDGRYSFSSADNVLTLTFGSRTLELLKMSED